MKERFGIEQKGKGRKMKEYMLIVIRYSEGISVYYGDKKSLEELAEKIKREEEHFELKRLSLVSIEKEF